MEILSSKIGSYLTGAGGVVNEISEQSTLPKWEGWGEWENVCMLMEWGEEERERERRRRINGAGEIRSWSEVSEKGDGV